MMLICGRTVRSNLRMVGMISIGSLVMLLSTVLLTRLMMPKAAAIKDLVLVNWIERIRTSRSVLHH